MTSEKLVCLFMLLLALCKGHYSLNSTQTDKSATGHNETVFGKGSFTPEGIKTRSESKATTPEQIEIVNELGSKGINQTGVDITEIFHGASNSTKAEFELVGRGTKAGEETLVNGTKAADEIPTNGTIITDCVNVTCVERSWNDTEKTNYTLMAEAVGALNSEVSALRVENSAAIAAGLFLVSAVLGYLSCVGYRRFLQRKYGNSQILIAEEVYDTTDLRYFEI